MNFRTSLFSIFIITGLGFSFIEFDLNHNINHNKKANAQVAILGIFHFSYTTDLSSITMENTLGEKRQSEIKELIEKIQKFKPTKILVEYPNSKADILNGNYQKYLSNEYTLAIDEIDQIGFRLAKNLSHDRLYAIDHKLDLPSDALYEFCQKNNKLDDFQSFIQRVHEYTGNETEILSKNTLSGYLSHMNSDQTDRITNELYLKDVLTFCDNSDQAGADFSATWYKRNMLILNNISNTIDQNEDRLLVIIGSAHRAVIKDFVEDRSDMTYIEIGEYLTKSETSD